MLLISFGTRPEYIKIKPLIEELQGKIEHVLLFTGQHEDLLAHVSDSTVRRLQIEDGTNRLDSIVSSIMNSDEVFEGVTSVLIQGDTSSAFAIALAAFHRKLKVVHLEAGLRTYDLQNPYPEEVNRQAVSRLADINLCPTEESAANLAKERISGKVYVVGNTVLDNIVEIEPEYSNKIVITMHRRENHPLIKEWFETIDSLAAQNPDLEFILPIHPNPNVYKHKDIFENVRVVDPMGYEDFVKLLSQSRFVITDSGGLQEESSFFRKKCIVCRKTTERVEGMGVFSTLCPTPDELPAAFSWAYEQPVPDPDEPCPYGDGHTSKKIAEIFVAEGI